ncbi:hypothetical protein [Flavobacterium akiainvivens]|uniref:hypothetical protein n=1 Tax=Flavobacterium akiainvivens TaxID=1202724 RepID=UPI0006C83E58|nr:hypothetical protein [Flavobacterium akiainvivens]SFQ50952.1 hypothetical protein SAMN05444144_106143 [Flavobacterium akiainvivens]
MKKVLIYGGVIALVLSCNDMKQKTKDTLNKGGEAVGEIATEVGEGISEGIDRTLESKVVLSNELIEKGLKVGKFQIESDSVNNPKANNNKLTIYIATEKAFVGVVTVKVSDKKGTEFGRKQLQISSMADDAAYYDVVFDPRTNIETRSTIEIQ